MSIQINEEKKLHNKITIYGFKNCDTCRKTLRVLPSAKFVDIREETDLQKKVPEWLNLIGADTLINTRSTTWRNLTAEERTFAPSELLVRYPTLIKRPVIEANGRLCVGWTKAIETELSK